MRDRALRRLRGARWLVAALTLALSAGFAVLAHGATPPYQKQRHQVVALRDTGAAGTTQHRRHHRHHRRRAQTQTQVPAAPSSATATPSTPVAPQPAPVQPQPQPQAPVAPPAPAPAPPVTTSGGS